VYFADDTRCPACSHSQRTGYIVNGGLFHALEMHVTFKISRHRLISNYASACRNRCFFSGYIHSTDIVKDVLTFLPLIFLEVCFLKCFAGGHFKCSPAWVQRTVKIQRTPSHNNELAMSSTHSFHGPFSRHEAAQPVTMTSLWPDPQK
jgi:hypothetical protein